MIVLATATKALKESEKDFLQRATGEINLRSLESGQSLINLVPYKNSLISIWEMSPNALETEPKE